MNLTMCCKYRIVFTSFCISALTISYPSKVLKQFCNSKHRNIRYIAASSLNLPYNCFIKLSFEDDLWIKLAISGNRSTPQEVLERYLNDSNPLVRECVRRQTIQFKNMSKK